MSAEKQSSAPKGHATAKDGAARQLLGMKGASETDDKWALRLQLMKPVTWIPLIWGVLCGAAASGEFTWTAENVAKTLLTMTMSGPLLTGYTQARGRGGRRSEPPPYASTLVVAPAAAASRLPCHNRVRHPCGQPAAVCNQLLNPRAHAVVRAAAAPPPAQVINDYYDREIDAINEPYRPIPSGRITEQEVRGPRRCGRCSPLPAIRAPPLLHHSQAVIQFSVLLAGGLAVGGILDVWCEHEWPIVFALAAGGSLISYIYSAPPLKLKQNGWTGNYALGSSYISLPWWAGQAVFGTLTPDIMVLTVLYSLAGLGIAIVNDFKSIEGDRKLGLQSLPVAFGIDTAKWICVGTIDVTQLAVAAYLYSIGEEGYALALLGLILPQMYAQYKYIIPDPVANDVKYQARARARCAGAEAGCAARDVVSRRDAAVLRRGFRAAQASAQPFLVFGLLTTGLAWGHHINPVGGGVFGGF